MVGDVGTVTIDPGTLVIADDKIFYNFGDDVNYDR